MTQEHTPAGDTGGASRAWFTRLLGVVVVIAVGAGVWGVAVLLGVLANPRPQLKAKLVGYSSGERVYSITLDTWPDSLEGVHGKNGGAHPDWVTYGPTTNLWVPAHSLIKMTVRNYDTAATLNDPFFAKVRGTVGGVVYYNGKPRRSLNPDQVAHTFTIHMFPTSGQSMFEVNVPMLAVSDNAPNLANGYPKPQVMTFEFRTHGPGRYIWQCFAPCGDPTYAGFGGPMSTLGYMTGSITVGGSHA